MIWSQQLTTFPMTLQFGHSSVGKNQAASELGIKAHSSNAVNACELAWELMVCSCILRASVSFPKQRSL